jgi:hypothetical protein
MSKGKLTLFPYFTGTRIVAGSYMINSVSTKYLFQATFNRDCSWPICKMKFEKPSIAPFFDVVITS